MTQQLEIAPQHNPKWGSIRDANADNGMCNRRVRVWDDESKTLIYTFTNNFIIGELLKKFDPVMGCSCLQDVSGQRIYDRDVVKFNNIRWSKDKTGVVEWNGDDGWIITQEGEYVCLLWETVQRNHYCEVIGNMYEGAEQSVD